MTTETKGLWLVIEKSDSPDRYLALFSDLDKPRTTLAAGEHIVSLPHALAAEDLLAACKEVANFLEGTEPQGSNPACAARAKLLRTVIAKAEP